MRSLLGIIFFGITLFSTAGAQDFTYRIKTDTIAYTIGANIGVTQEWRYPKDKAFDAPELPPSLGKLEKVSERTPEKEAVDGQWLFRRKATYTCFDTGYYQVKGLGWKVGEDSVFSNSLVFRISLMEVDTALDIKDIEPPIPIPYTLKEVLPYVAVVLGVLLVATLLIVLLILRKNRKEPSLAPKRPAYIIAYEKLEDLKSQRLWEKGMFKEYHVNLSSIVREYIQYRYQVTTQELTTEELLTLCSTLEIPEDLLGELKKTLQIGDLAKFAKANPSPQQNEDSWTSVYDFVSKTNVVQPKEDQKDAS